MVECYPGETSGCKPQSGKADDGRLLTAIIYLNKDWTAQVRPPGVVRQEHQVALLSQ